MDADTTLLRLREGAAEWLAEDGEAVLLDLDRSWYMGLNKSATLLWTELSRGTTRDRLVEQLRTGYALSESRAAADVDAFVVECIARGLLG